MDPTTSADTALGGEGAPERAYETSDGRRRNMRANRRKDTKPELALRALLHRSGLRYRTDFRISAGQLRPRPDLAFTRIQLAVFVDGCFWHNCPIHGRMPGENTSYWVPKLERNHARDLAQTAALRELGWTVLRFWEHEPPEAAAEVVKSEVARLRSAVKPR